MVKGWEGLREIPSSSANRDKNLPINKSTDIISWATIIF